MYRYRYIHIYIYLHTSFPLTPNPTEIIRWAQCKKRCNNLGCAIYGGQWPSVSEVMAIRKRSKRDNAKESYPFIVHNHMHQDQSVHNTCFRIGCLTSGPFQHFSISFGFSSASTKSLWCSFSNSKHKKSLKKSLKNSALQSQVQGTTPMIYTMSVMELGLITVELNACFPPGWWSTGVIILPTQTMH